MRTVRIEEAGRSIQFQANDEEIKRLLFPLLPVSEVSREGPWQLHGEDHWKHELTDDKVREIRRRYVPRDRNGNSIPGLSKEFGVHETCIYKIVSGKSWKHLL